MALSPVGLGPRSTGPDEAAFTLRRSILQW